MMKVAYLVVGHRNPQQALRLVRVLKESPASDVVVRHPQLDSAAVEHAGGLLLRDERDVPWGSWSFLRMLIRGLGQIAVRLDPDWVLVLSGQDYPLKPMAEIERRLAETEEDALLGATRDVPTATPPAPPAEEFFLRYAYSHWAVPHGTPNLPARVRPFAYLRERPAPLEPMLGIRRLRLPYDERRPCFVSSDWVTLGRHGLRAVLEAAREDRRLMRHYRRSHVPSESFFATVLLNDRALRVDHDHRRFAPFQRGAAHPDTLTTSDLGRTLASGADFGRKFDAEIDGGVLDRLDELRGGG